MSASPAVEPAVSWPQVLACLVRGEDLDDATAAAVMGEIMRGEASSARIAALLVGLRLKGESVSEIAGLARTMRAYAVAIDPGGPAVDTCGTGGDGAGTFNVSTVSALVAAAAGARVVKHGNRAVSGRCGSADLLEAWGVVIDLAPSGVEACLREAGIGFCFAPRFHPAMRHVMPTRRELGVPTVFNFLGPLTNPAGVAHQTIGVSDPVMAGRIATVLARLGAEHALVFHGSDGLDELTTTGPSRLWEVRDGQVSESRFDPAEHGIARAEAAALLGGDLDDNRHVADRVLAGEPGAARDIVVLGAAAALLAGDVVEDWQQGLQAAATALDSGAAARVLQQWVEVSNRHAEG